MSSPSGRSSRPFTIFSLTAAGRKRLDLVEMLGHKGESLSQAIVELGFQLMAMRLKAEKAVDVTRAFERSASIITSRPRPFEISKLTFKN